MKIKTNWDSEIELLEGDYIKKGTAPLGCGEVDEKFSGVVFLSLGLCIDKDGIYTDLSDIEELDERDIKPATKKQIERVIQNMKGIYTPDKEIALEYLKNSEEILPVKYGLVENKEKLLKMINNRKLEF